MPTILVRYGELGLKSPSVRRRFENALVDDLRKRHARAMVQCVISTTRGRVFVDSDDWRVTCEILAKTFGVVSFSPVTESDSDLDHLTTAVLDFARPLLYDGSSFAMRIRRTGNHNYTSQTLAEKLGAEVLLQNKGRGIHVSLTKPDVEIFVEVREKKGYLYSSVLSGPGGMPFGTQGKMLSVVDSELGVASSWLMMKRGCNVVIATDNPQSVKCLESWCPSIKTVGTDPDVFELANRNECIGVTYAWTFKDIERSRPIKGDLPVFYPLVGMNEEETKGLMNRIKA